ncbi:MAG TPA: metal-dependent hydrolase [Burkholderiales bacterium]|nr:metal-dependent hydrolase [Burkholderiales bacterium]
MNAHTPLNLRRFAFPFPKQIPSHWCGGDAALTHLLNTYTVLVPGNEGFYIRTLQACRKRLADRPDLSEAVRLFCLQEGQHGVGHRRFWEVLDYQGYRYKGFERAVAIFAYKFLERITPLKVRLSMVACVEHINAFIGEEFLRARLLCDADPSARALFEWHFAEEIEHKAVAFDVLKHVAPSYATRLLGFLLVVPFFYLLEMIGALNFLRQDKLLFKRSTWRSFRLHFWRRDHMARKTIGHLLAYLKPGFHPRNTDNDHLASEVMARYTAMEACPIESVPDRRSAAA